MQQPTGKTTSKLGKFTNLKTQPETYKVALFLHLPEAFKVYNDLVFANEEESNSFTKIWRCLICIQLMKLTKHTNVITLIAGTSSQINPSMHILEC